MKVCPVCGRDYADELVYCLEDGTPLSATPEKITERKTEEFGEPTFVRSAQTIAAHAPARPARSSNKLRVFLLVGLVLAGVLVLVGALVLVGVGLAGTWFYHSTGANVAKSNSIDSGLNTNANLIGNTNISNTVGPNTNAQQTSSPTSNSLDLRPAPTPDRNLPNANKLPSPYPSPEKAPTPPKTISGGVLNGKAVSLPKPPFPPAARAVRASGSVSVQVLIDESGNVVSAAAVSGHPLLRSAAVAAARGAKFSPTSLAGQPVKVSGVISYNFVP